MRNLRKGKYYTGELNLKRLALRFFQEVGKFQKLGSESPPKMFVGFMNCIVKTDYLNELEIWVSVSILLS